MDRGASVSKGYLEVREQVLKYTYTDMNFRAYLKTRRGVYFKELSEESNENNFLKMLIGNVINEVSKVV